MTTKNRVVRFGKKELALAGVLVAFVAQATVTPTTEGTTLTLAADAEGGTYSTEIPSTITTLIKTGSGNVTLTCVRSRILAACTEF